MPILEQPHPDWPLSQGDILTGVRLSVTASPWGDGGGSDAKAPFNICMVLSRPCVAAHKETFLVAAVEMLKSDPPKGAEGFDKVLSFMTGLRDGRNSPDVFYLGQLPNKNGRYVARFDSVHTVQTPTNPDEMKAFLGKSRIATLTIDFCRDLHVRLFNAFASLGFDDHGWPSTADLQWIVNQGDADVKALETELSKKKAAKASNEAQGKKFPDGEIENAERACQEFHQKLDPYVLELDKRSKK
jgi:hypothetical protein